LEQYNGMFPFQSSGTQIDVFVLNSGWFSWRSPVRIPAGWVSSAPQG